VMGRDLEQTDAEWEAEDRAGQGGDDLRHGQPGSDLLGCCAQRQRHAEARLASRTVAKAAKIGTGGAASASGCPFP
jgi:hypothetical protein